MEFLKILRMVVLGILVYLFKS